MARTQPTGKQIADGSIQRDDLDVATASQAVVRKLVQGAGIALSSTGADAGTGDVTVAVDGNEPGQFALLSDLSPAQITADQNDYNPTGLSTASVLRLDADANHNITGIAGGTDGRILIIENVATGPLITLTNQDTGSSAANRFLLGESTEIGQNASCVLQYDGTSSRWRCIAQFKRPTAGPDADITVNAAGAAGTASRLARAGHGHKLNTSAINGVGTNAARPASAAANAGALYQTTDNPRGQWYDNGSLWLPTGLLVASKSALTARNNTVTLVADPDLITHSLEVSSSYGFILKLLATGVSVNADLKLGWTGPTGASMAWGAPGGLVGTSSVSFIAVPAATTPNAAAGIATSLPFGLGNLTTGLILVGSFVTDATHPGVFSLTWAQNTQTVENVTLQASSSLTYWKES